MASTYSALQTEIATWMVREDLDDLIPSFIAGAEELFNSTLRLPEMEDVVTSAVSSGTVTLPSDFLEMRSLWIDADPAVPLSQVGIAQIKGMYAGVASGTPRHFALQSGTELVLGPAPDGEISLVLNYYAKIPALSDSNASNWLLASNPTLYRAASLIAGFQYTRHFDEAKGWEEQTALLLTALQKQGLRKAWSATPARIRNPITV